MTSPRWRYLAQDLLTREWLSTDLDLGVDVEVETAVSAPGGITAVVPADLIEQVDHRGRPLLHEWRTAIYAEADDAIRGAGILVRSAESEEGHRWSLEAPGFSSYLTGIPYNSTVSGWSIDPFMVVRNIWDHVQKQPRGNIEMQVSQRSSGTTVGDVKPPPRPEDVPKQTFKAPLKGPRPKNASAVAAWEADYKARRKEYDRGRKRYAKDREETREAQRAWDKLYRDRKPYELFWWEAPDCGGEVDRLATEVPFDYMERHRWNAVRTDIEHHLDLKAPMIGKRRNELRFVLGENVAAVPLRVHDGDAYCNQIIGLGKGEGRKMVRVEISGGTTDRLRRPGVLALKEVGSASRLRALSAAELNRASAIDNIEELLIWDHSNAPLGSYAAGDEVLVVDERHSIPKRMWVRILSITVNPARSDLLRLRVVNARKA